MKRYAYSLLLLLALPLGLLAQTFTPAPDWRFENFNNQSHFLGRYMSNVAVDKQGYIWTSGNGIQRFDGFRTVDYSSLNADNAGLKNNYTDVLADNTNRIWVSSYGLCYYNNATAKFTYIQPTGKPDMLYAYAFNINRGYLWFVSNYGLAKVNLKTLKISFTSLTNLPNGICSYFISANTLLISSREKVYLYNVSKNTYTASRWVYDNKLVKVFAVQKHGSAIYIGSGNGLLKLQPSGKLTLLDEATKNIEFNDMLFMPQDKEEKYLFLATDGQGLMIYNTVTGKMEATYAHDDVNPYCLSSNIINAMHADAAGKLWMATAAGVSMLDVNNQQWKMRFLDKSNTDEQTIFKINADKYDSTKFWISRYNQGLVQLNTKTKKIENKYLLPPANARIIDFVQTGKDKWLLATHTDICEWSPKAGLMRALNNFPLPDSLLLGLTIRRLLLTDAQTCFITTSKGLFKYSLASHMLSNAFKHNEALGVGLIDLLQDKGQLWITADSALLNYTIATQKGAFYYRQKASRHYLKNIVSDGGDNIIASTISGIAIFSKTTKKFNWITTLAGYTNPSCTSIFRIKNKIWLGTETGIITYDLGTKKSEKVQYETPLMETFVRSPFTMLGDDIAVGFRSGYAYFNPGLNNASMPSSPVIDGVQVNNQPVMHNAPKPLVFDHNNNSVNIAFTAFLYTYPDNVSFRYRLKGTDAGWQYTRDQRSANYAQLAPGQYTFYVQSGNSVGVWNKQLASFSFTIKPPYWATWWFRLLVVLIIAFGLYQLYRYKIEHMRDIEVIRQGIATDFHDDLGSTLSSISIFSQVAIKKAETDLPSTKKMVDDIGIRARDMIQSMNDMVWAIKPENDNLYRLMQRMEEFGYPVAEAKETQLTFLMDESLYTRKTEMIKRKNLFLIFKEAFNNTIKYSNATEIDVTFKLLNKRTIEMQITDNGCGFDMGARKAGNGINNIKKRAHEVKAGLTIKSAPGQGTALNIICKIA